MRIRSSDATVELQLRDRVVTIYPESSDQDPDDRSDGHDRLACGAPADDAAKDSLFDRHKDSG